MRKADAFMILDEDGLDEHLQVLLTEPDDFGEVVTASICTLRARTESLVIVEVGEHPFITRRSAVPYRHAQVRLCSTIQAALERGDARQKSSVTASLLKRMQSGLMESDFTPNGVRAYFRLKLVDAGV